jgi:hypothetical protein
MIALLWFLLTLFASPFKSKCGLEAENAALRHQLSVLRRKVRGRIRLTNGDRLFLVQLYRWFPSVVNAIAIILGWQVAEHTYDSFMIRAQLTLLRYHAPGSVIFPVLSENLIRPGFAS